MPRDYYDERIVDIDEQICSLIQQRKNFSNNNPGFPPFEKIASWASKYGLYEDLLKSLYDILRNEEHFRPRVEPAVFRKQLPVLKSVENDGDMYTVTFIRQYENASVVYLHIDFKPIEQKERPRQKHHRYLEMKLGDGYDCRNNGGNGSEDYQSFQFVVAPPIRDDLSNIHLVFEEYKSLKGEATEIKVIEFENITIYY